jgi:hypothetical protein
MTNSAGHLLEQRERRVYAGEPWAHGLIAWIEKNRGRASGRRIQALLREMREIGEGLEGPVFGHSQTGIPTVVRLARSPDAAARNEALRNSINRRLRRYRLWPELLLLPKPGTPNRWFPRWHAEGERSRTPNSLSEADALLRILLLAQNGNVHRLRECDDCGLWFFARFKHARFCSTECQQRNYRRSPEWRERRNEYMREYYRQNLKTEPR